MSDQRYDISAWEDIIRAREGRETLDAEIVMERTRIRRMFDQAKSVVANWRPTPTPDEWGDD